MAATDGEVEMFHASAYTYTACCWSLARRPDFQEQSDRLHQLGGNRLTSPQRHLPQRLAPDSSSARYHGCSQLPGLLYCMEKSRGGFCRRPTEADFGARFGR